MSGDDRLIVMDVRKEVAVRGGRDLDRAPTAGPRALAQPAGGAGFTSDRWARDRG